MDSIDLRKPFNHYSVIIYYAAVNLEERSYICFDSEYVYSYIDSLLVEGDIPNVKNTTIEIYYLGDNRILNWKMRKLGVLDTSSNIHGLIRKAS